MKNRHSIRTKLVFSHAVVILTTVTLLAGAFLFAVSRALYGGVSDGFAERMSTVSSYVNKLSQNGTLQESARHLFEQLPEDAHVLTELFEPDGKLLLDSTGLPSVRMMDAVEMQSASKNGLSFRISGSRVKGERLMINTYALTGKDRTIGYIRFSTSLRVLDQTFLQIAFGTLLVGMMIMLLALAVSFWLSSRVIRPLKELEKLANVYAAGKLHERIERTGKDEFGLLGATMNRMADELQRANRIKSEFISSVSHELRTPLTSIQGWSETLLDGELDDKEELETGLRMMSAESRRLAAMVNDLLDLSTIQAGRMKLQLEMLCAEEMMNEAFTLFAASAARKRISLEQMYDRQSRTLLFADQSRLKQILVNVLDNALKFTPAGKAVRLQIDASDQKQGHVTLEIEDEGIGISEEQLAHVTEKFVKGDHKMSGSGLGLAISSEIAELHGGRLELSSKEGGGTRVRIFIPRHTG